MAGAVSTAGGSLLSFMGSWSPLPAARVFFGGKEHSPQKAARCEGLWGQHPSGSEQPSSAAVPCLAQAAQDGSLRSPPFWREVWVIPGNSLSWCWARPGAAFPCRADWTYLPALGVRRGTTRSQRALLPFPTFLCPSCCRGMRVEMAADREPPPVSPALCPPRWHGAGLGEAAEAVQPQNMAGQRAGSATSPWLSGGKEREGVCASGQHAHPWLCGLAAVAQGKRVRTRPHLAQYNPLMAALLQRHPPKTARTNTPRSKLLCLHLFSSFNCGFFPSTPQFYSIFMLSANPCTAAAPSSCS